MLNVVHEYSTFYTVYYLFAAGSTNTCILYIVLPIVIIILILIGIIIFSILLYWKNLKQYVKKLKMNQLLQDHGKENF